MKRALPLFCALALLLSSCSSNSESDSKGPRVIVLGIDGGTWTMIEPMMEAGELPNLKKLCDKGLHGIMESRPPIISPVVWTTIFTGFLHGKHGIHDWKTSQSVNRKVNAIWEILAGKKLKVDVFNVPGSWPPDQVPGVMVSGFPLSGSTFGGNTGEVVKTEDLEAGKLSVPYRDSKELIREAIKGLEVGKWTPWFAGKVTSRPGFRGMMRAYRMNETDYYLTPHYRVDPGIVVTEPKTLRADLAKKLGEPYIPEGPGWSRWAEDYAPDVLYKHLEQVFSIQSNAAVEYAASDWRLFIYVMTLTDRISHPYWAYAHAEDFPSLDPVKAKKYESAVGDAYRRSDEEIGKILAKVTDDPYVLVVSDHGFQSSTDREKPIGTHNPDGIYIVSGPGITPGAGVPKYIEDVAPTLLYLMNLAVGQDMDGKVFEELPEMLKREPRTVATYEKGGRASTDKPVDNDTWESLRGLGYVDGAPPRAGEKKPGQKPPPKPKPGQKPGDAAKNPPGKKPGDQMNKPGQKPKPGDARMQNDDGDRPKPPRVPPKMKNDEPEADAPPKPRNKVLENWPAAPAKEE